jgi:hypothetical protein
LAKTDVAFRRIEDIEQALKLFLVICFSAAFVAISAMSLLGTEWVPNWLLPSLVFGVPAFAILIVLASSYSGKRADPEEKISAKE